MDVYFECITTCPLDDLGTCQPQCVEQLREAPPDPACRV
jgi:hypothetical protein